MKITSAHLRPGMWVENVDGHHLMLHRKITEGAVNGWVLDNYTFLADDRADFLFEEELLFIANCPANVGPLLELCREIYGPTCFFDWTRSNVRPWRVFPSRGAAPVACEPTLCRALLAALEAAP